MRELVFGKSEYFCKGDDKFFFFFNWKIEIVFKRRESVFIFNGKVKTCFWKGRRNPHQKKENF